MAKLAFIGAGSMGQAIASGLVEAGLYKANEIVLFARDLDRLENIAKQGGYAFAKSLEDLLSSLDNDACLVFAVKPQGIDEVISQIKNLNPSVLLISVLAGTKISKFEKAFPQNPVIRVMPNTPSQIRKGASAIAANSNCSAADIHKVKAMFDAIGLAVVVEEKDLDVVTGLSGSGPAYVFLMIEAMAEAAIKLGLNEEAAKALALQTVYGAASLAKASDKSPGELRVQVTSPNGTTAAGLDSLADSGFKEIVFRAISAAEKRSKELG